MWSKFNLKKLQAEHPLPSLRHFGLVFAVVFALMFLLKNDWSYVQLSIFCALAAFVCPGVFFIPNFLWHRFGLIVGWVMTPIVLAFLYFIVFVPMALVMKLFGHKGLSLKGEWVKKEKSPSFERIF